MILLGESGVHRSSLSDLSPPIVAHWNHGWEQHSRDGVKWEIGAALFLLSQGKKLNILLLRKYWSLEGQSYYYGMGGIHCQNMCLAPYHQSALCSLQDLKKCTGSCWAGSPLAPATWSSSYPLCLWRGRYYGLGFCNTLANQLLWLPVMLHSRPFIVYVQGGNSKLTSKKWMCWGVFAHYP